MKDNEIKALLVGIELEKAKRRNYTSESGAEQELRELEQAERTAKRLKSEMAHNLFEGHLWDDIKAQREFNKENKRKRKTLWFKVKKLLGLV